MKNNLEYATPGYGWVQYLRDGKADQLIDNGGQVKNDQELIDCYGTAQDLMGIFTVYHVVTLTGISYGLYKLVENLI